jgi:hypothetical protein
MWEVSSTIIDLLTLFLVMGISVRIYIHNNYINKIHHLLFEAEQENQEQITEFMESFAESLEVFAKEEMLKDNQKEIKEWDES